LIAPLLPAIDPLPGKKLKVRPWAASLGKIIDGIRLLGMLFFAGDYYIHLASAWLQRPHAAFNSKEKKLCHVTEVETYPAPVRAAIFSHLQPHDIRFVCKPPRLHNRQGLREKSVWAPEVEVAFRE